MFTLPDRDYALILLGDDIDLEAQIIAIRHALSRARQADAALADDIDDLARRARAAAGAHNRHLTDLWVDQLLASVYQDAAHSLAATGMLAPTIESLFVAIFCGLRDIETPAGPIVLHGNRVKKTSDARIWDPHWFFGDPLAPPVRDLVRGIGQLAESAGLTAYLPEGYLGAIDALFSYRNKILHHGSEWPVRERHNLTNLIRERRWPDDWFAHASCDDEPWIIYMTDDLIQTLFSTIDAVLNGVGRFVRERYEAVPLGDPF